MIELERDEVFDAWRAKWGAAGCRVERVASLRYGGPHKWTAFKAEAPDRGKQMSSFVQVPAWMATDKFKSQEVPVSCPRCKTGPEAHGCEPQGITN